ncbi:MAG: amidase [Candidatus Nanopelagicales bacterium]
MRHDEYASYDALGLAQLIRDGEVSATDVLQAAIARRQAVNKAINAVVESWDAEALDRASSADTTGVFGGVPFLIKDMDGKYAGHRSTNSSRSLVNYVPERSSELMNRFETAGLNIFGATNCPEFGIMGVSEPELRGPARNPWNLGHTPGGSSGGSAAAIAAGIVPMAHGGDGGGSLRIPASHCGLFGLKTTRGLIPLGPDEAEGWDGLVVRGVMSRTVRDTAAALDVTRGWEPGSPYAVPDGPASYLEAATRDPGRLRIAYSTRSLFGSKLSPDAVQAVDEAASLLQSLGHEVFEYDLPISADEGAKAYLTIVAANVAYTVRWTEEVTGRKPDPHDFERATWLLNQAGQVIPAVDLTAARAWGLLRAREFADLFGPTFDLHLTSTVAQPPVAIGELAPKPAEKAALSVLQRVGPPPVLRRLLDQLATDSLEATPQTQIYNMTGQPAMSVPMHVTRAGLPMGVQIAAAFGDDARLLQVASQIEQAKPWVDGLPTTKQL